MIELYLRGGLGNQLFQYAMVRNLQLKYQCEMSINTHNYTSGKDIREYGLDVLCLPPEVKIVDREHRILFYLNVLDKALGKHTSVLSKPLNIVFWKENYYKEFTFDLQKQCIVYGYFQSGKYFYENHNIIKQELRVRDDKLYKIKPKIKEISQEESVCVHIRRGDYIKEGLLVCSIDYYLKGIKYMREHLTNPIFYIFSDDIGWVKDRLGDDNMDHVRFVDDVNVDYLELALMYSCKHFVISNSSFSWWAQYLADNPNKIVVAPSKWVPNEDGYSVRDINLQSWICL